MPSLSLDLFLVIVGVEAKQKKCAPPIEGSMETEIRVSEKVPFQDIQQALLPLVFDDGIPPYGWICN